MVRTILSQLKNTPPKHYKSINSPVEENRRVEIKDGNKALNRLPDTNRS